MPYKQRRYEPGSVWHMTAQVVADEWLFVEDVDRFDFLRVLEDVTERIGWLVDAWCLMGTHYHLLVAAGPQAQVSLGMQMLNSNHARAVNRRYDRRGHLFGARYRPTAVDSSGQLAATRAYVLRNPVRAGLVARIEDWPWSGTSRLVRREVATEPAPNRHVPVRPRG
jgi:putative transposase